MRFLLLESLCTETCSPAPAPLKTQHRHSSPVPASLNSSYYGLHSDKASDASLPGLSPDNVLLLCCSSQASTTMATEKQHGGLKGNWATGDQESQVQRGKHTHYGSECLGSNLITSLIPNAQLLQTDLWYGAKTQSCDRPFSRLHRLAYNAAWKRAGTVSSHLKSFCFKRTAANEVYRKQGGGWAEVNGKWSQNKKIT